MARLRCLHRVASSAVLAQGAGAEWSTPSGRVGAFARYFAKRYGDSLAVAPVRPDARQPSLPFSYAMALSVREGDVALRDELPHVLDRRKARVERILRDHAVPLVATALPITAGE